MTPSNDMFVSDDPSAASKQAHTISDQILHQVFSPEIGPGRESKLRILLVTSRPMFYSLLAAYGRSSEPRLLVSTVKSQPADLLTARAAIAAVDVAIVDVAANPEAAVHCCRTLRALQPSVPILAMLCCPASVQSEQIRALVAGGVEAVLDVQATPESLLRTLQRLAAGEVGLQVLLRPEYRIRTQQFFGPGEDVPPAREPVTVADQRLLELVARGLTDAEIGRHLHLSKDTIHHRIQRLCAATKTCNRTELAAWAAAEGLYGRADG